MSSLGNSPSQLTVIRAEARKSFSLGVRLYDPRARAVDLTGCTLTIVAKKPPFDTTSDATNLLAPDATAAVIEPTDGYARFDLQASTLDHPAGEYPFVIVLRSPDGYSSVIVKGTLEILENPEVESATVDYTQSQSTLMLDLLLRDRNVVVVRVGSQLPPGMNYVPDDLMAAITEFDPDAVAMVPTGGTAGYVLTKIGNGDYAMDWRPPEQGGELSAVGQPEGNVPVAQGDGTWTWAPASIDADGVAQGWAPVSNGDGTWSWAEVSMDQPDWDAAEEEPGHILNKPELGTAAAKNEEDFLAADTLLTQLPGVHVQTTVPTSGEEGHIFFVYEE